MRQKETENVQFEEKKRTKELQPRLVLEAVGGLERSLMEYREGYPQSRKPIG